MRYVYCVVIPLLLQIVTVYITIKMNTGNGSWLGLGVLLLAIPTLPITTLINALRTKSKPDIKTIVLFGQSLLIAYIVPFIIVALYTVSIFFEAVI